MDNINCRMFKILSAAYKDAGKPQSLGAPEALWCPKGTGDFLLLAFDAPSHRMQCSTVMAGW